MNSGKCSLDRCLACGSPGGERDRASDHVWEADFLTCASQEVAFRRMGQWGWPQKEESLWGEVRGSFRKRRHPAQAWRQSWHSFLYARSVRMQSSLSMKCKAGEKRWAEMEWERSKEFRLDARKQFLPWKCPQQPYTFVHLSLCT